MNIDNKQQKMNRKEELFSKERSARVAALLVGKLKQLGFSPTEVERYVLHARNGYFSFV